MGPAADMGPAAVNVVQTLLLLKTLQFPSSFNCPHFETLGKKLIKKTSQIPSSVIFENVNECS